MVYRTLAMIAGVMLVAIISITHLTFSSAQEAPLHFSDPLVPVYYEDTYTAQNYFLSPAPQISADGKSVLFLPGAGWRLPPVLTPSDKVVIYYRDAGKIVQTDVYGKPYRSDIPFDYAPQFRGDAQQAVYNWPGIPVTTIYLRDVQQGTQIELKPTPIDPYSRKYAPIMSEDGRVVGFASQANKIKTNLAEIVRPRLNLMTLANNRNESILVPNVGANDLLSVHLAPHEDPYVPAFSDLRLNGDGRVLVFNAMQGKDLPPGSPRTLMLYNRNAKTFATVTITPQGKPVAANAIHPRISSDGNAVTFASSSPALANGDTNTVSDVFVYDVKSKQLRRVSVASNGVQVDKPVLNPVINGNGRFVVFQSTATTLAPVTTHTGKDTDTSEIFLHDRQTGETICVSEGSRSIQQKLALPYHSNTDPSISADGRFICYVTRISDAPPHTDEPAPAGKTPCVILTFAVQIYDRETKATNTVLSASNLPLDAQANIVAGPEVIPADELQAEIRCTGSRRLLFTPLTGLAPTINVTDLLTGEQIGRVGVFDILQSDGDYALAGDMLVAINRRSDTVAGFSLKEVLSTTNYTRTPKWKVSLGNTTDRIVALPDGQHVLVAETATCPQAVAQVDIKPTGRVVKIDAQTGKVNWAETLVPGGNTGKYLTLQGMIKYQGTIFVASHISPNSDYPTDPKALRSYLFALDAETGRTKWRYPTNGRLRIAGIANDTLMLETDPQLYADEIPLQVIAIDTTNGQLRWQQSGYLLLITPQYTRVYQSATGNTVLVGTRTGTPVVVGDN